MNLFSQLHPDWQVALKGMRANFDSIEKIIENQEIVPSYGNVLAALRTPIDSIRVVIFGQDPYPRADYANGLAFSVRADVHPLPATLKNIYKELENDCNIESTMSGDLTRWSNQGVLLLNRILTTRVNESMAHRDIGWQVITDEIARILGSHSVVAILWGKNAQELKPYFKEEFVITSVHPSPLSAYRGFFGSKPFSRANEILKNQKHTSIDW